LAGQEELNVRPESNDNTLLIIQAATFYYISLHSNIFLALRPFSSTQWFHWDNCAKLYSHKEYNSAL
jgi:hypothetical protein